MKILVAVIAYNEEKNIKATLRDLILHKKDFDIVVIDNSSNDHTVKYCLEMGIDVLSHSINTGGSFGTVTTYFIYALKYNYDIVCQFDGDGQHLASELKKIITPLVEEKADLVIGSRFLEKEGFQSYFFRRLGIRLFAFIDSLIINQKMTDVTSGFKAYNRSIIDFYGNYYKHEIFDTNQLIILSYFAGARILEVPVLMKERSYGNSEYNVLTALTYPFKGLINILGCLLQKVQIKNFIKSKNGN